MTYGQLKKERQAKYDELFEKVHLFWAFGNEQWEEGKKKHPVTEGHKYVSIGMGGYFPGQHKQEYIEGMDAIRAWEKQAKAELKANEAAAHDAILYELNNHECFYTGEIDEVCEIFEGVYTREQIKKVYRQNAGRKKARA